MTWDEARALWVSENPYPLTVYEDGETRETTQAEYDAMADHGADTVLAAHEAEQAHEADRVEGAGIMDKARLLDDTADRLDSPEAFTNTQFRHVVAEHMRVTAQMIRYLNKHADQPLPETPP